MQYRPSAPPGNTPAPSGYKGIQGRKGECYLHRLGQWLPFDSDLERQAMILLDACPDVTSVERSQGITVHSPSGKVSTYTADLTLQLTNTQRLTLEVKPEELLHLEVVEKAAEWQRRADVLEELRRPLHLVTDRDLPRERLLVAEACMPFHNVEACKDVASAVHFEISKRSSVPFSLMRDLVRAAPGINATLAGQTDATLRGMIARGELHLDLTPGQLFHEGTLMLPSPRNRLAAAIGKPVVERLASPTEPPASPATIPEVSLVHEEQRFLGTASGQTYQKLFSLYPDPGVRLNAALLQNLSRETGLSRRQLFRFRDSLRKAGAPGVTFPDVLPFLPAFARTHTPSRTVDPRVAAIIDEVARDIYFRKVGHSGRATTIAGLTLEVARKCHQEGLPVPAHTTVKRHIDRIAASDPVAAARARQGDDAAYQVEARMSSFQVREYGELWAVDCTPADVFAVVAGEQDRNHRFRPRVVTVVDVATGQVLRSTCYPHGVGANEILQVLQGIFLGRSDEFRVAGVKDIPQAHGLPKAIRMDSGTEFANRDVTRVLHDLGVDVIRRNKGTRHYGGMEERTIGSLVRTHHGLPGTTMSSINSRQGYDAKAKARLDLESFNLYHTRMVELYNQKPRMNQMASRHDHAARLIAQGRSALRPLTPSQLHYIQDRMFVEAGRLVSRTGINVNALTYTSPALAPLAVTRERVTVSHDPGDIRSINVIHPGTGAIITAHARFPQDFLEALPDREAPVPKALWDAYRKGATAFAQAVRLRLPTTRQVQQEVLEKARVTGRKPRRGLRVQEPAVSTPDRVNSTIEPAELDIVFDQEA